MNLILVDLHRSASTRQNNFQSLHKTTEILWVVTIVTFACRFKIAQNSNLHTQTANSNSDFDTTQKGNYRRKCKSILLKYQDF